MGTACHPSQSNAKNKLSRQEICSRSSIRWHALHIPIISAMHTLKCIGASTRWHWVAMALLIIPSPAADRILKTGISIVIGVFKLHHLTSKQGSTKSTNYLKLLQLKLFMDAHKGEPKKGLSGVSDADVLYRNNISKCGAAELHGMHALCILICLD